MAKEPAGGDESRQRTLDLAQAYLVLLSEGKLSEWIELWHDEAVLGFPFAPPGRPSSYVGKANILAYMTAGHDRIRIDRVEEMRLHPGADPDVLVVELATRGHLVHNGARYDQSYVSVFECRDGLLWRYREYWNPLISIDAFGSLDQWLAS
jgi:hypothetical protein